MFDLDADPEVIDAHLARDPRLRPLVRAHRGLRVPGRDRPGRDRRPRDPRSAGVGRARDPPRGPARRRLRHAGRRARARSASPTSSPSPRRCADAPIADARDARRPGGRDPGLRGVDRAARRVAGPRRRSSASCAGSPASGEWTAQYVAMRAAGERDAFPAGDLGLRQALGGDAQAVAARGRGVPALAGVRGDAPVVQRPRPRRPAHQHIRVSARDLRLPWSSVFSA